MQRLIFMLCLGKILSKITYVQNNIKRRQLIDCVVLEDSVVGNSTKGIALPTKTGRILGHQAPCP